MPLHLLVPSLKRVKIASSSEIDNMESPHPLHSILEPLLLSVRSAASKYQTELPLILANNGGEGEIEERMMWFALNHEKGDEDDPSHPSGEDSVVIEERWRNKWLERLERRE